MKPTLVRRSSWRAIPFLVLAMPAIWGLGTLLARQAGCDPTEASWRSSAMTLCWLVGAVVYALINGGIAWGRGEGAPLASLLHPNLLVPKRIPQQFPDVLQEGLKFALIVGVLAGLLFRTWRFAEDRWSTRHGRQKPVGPAIDPDF